jgi:hypothetical protein
MQETIQNEIEIHSQKFNISLNPKIYPNTSSLKGQLEELLGKTDFKNKLEKVNLTIGIVISVILLLFVFI